MNAPTYPDADQIAPSRPTPSSAPAPPFDLTTLSIGPRNVSTADAGPTSRRMSSSAFVVCGCCPTRPRIDTSTIRPGNRARTE
jgi:hypothetical protein